MARKKNALDIVPVKRPFIHTLEENGVVKLKIYRNKWWDKLMHRIFKTPLEVTIDLDEIGSEVWRLIDGHKTIREIGQQLEANLGEKAQPTYPRLLTFVKYLYGADLITYRRGR
ncbi:PqqD family protein [Coprothermobacteraceae bacterium]|nr:PqqD family protein [Coprothermobacteraceae bacterium]